MKSVYHQEEILYGGTTNAGLVTRVGNTVRRPNRPTSEATRALLHHLEAVGFEGAPRYLGTDDRGREMLSYVEGVAPIAPYPQWAFDDLTLVSVAELLRGFHDAVASFDASGFDWPHPIPSRFRSGIITHNDPNLDNIIFSNGRAVALIDFDLASPGSVGWELACAARLWVPLRDAFDTPAQLGDRALSRLALFADTYGATDEQRRDMVDAIVVCHEWCYAIVGAAAAKGHAAFGSNWRGGGRERAQRTRRRLESELPQIRGVLCAS